MSDATDLAKPPKARILGPVFYPSAGLILLLVALSFVAPKESEALFRAAQNWVAADAGWFTVLSVAGFLVFVVGVAISSFGKLKLGPDHSTPDFSYLTWLSMLFAAGMGIGLMFFGVAEPVMHYASPPEGSPATMDAARQAMRITFFHWGIHAWAVYAVVALSLAYFAYRHDLPLRIRSCLYPLIGERIHGPLGHAVDTFAVLGTIFGLATSLGLGVIQINSGLNYLLGVEVSVTTQVILIIVISLIATASVVTGLEKGVRRLSELNMLLATLLMLFVLLTGPSVYLLQTLVQNTGMYISNVFEMTFNLYAYQSAAGSGEWIGGWTLFYWGWWIAWSPFVGMFIARISRGRTVREFVVSVLFVPLGFTFMWMTFYGNTALHMIMADGMGSLLEAVSADSSVALFKFLEALPLSVVTSIVATLLVVFFFVTSSDSGSLVIDMLTSEGEEMSPLWQRIFWALLSGVIAIALLIAGGLKSLQAATIASALPFTIIMWLMCWGMLRAMRLEITKRTAARQARIAPPAGSSDGEWRARLRALTHQPLKHEVLAYMGSVVQPALEEVAAELRKQGIEVEVRHERGERVWLQVGHGEEMDFFYSVHPVVYQPASFMLEDPRRKVKDDDQFYRAEVFLLEGGQGYDVMGWSKHGLIHDVLDQYQRHIHFLDHIR